MGEEDSRAFLIEKLAEASRSMDVNLEVPEYKSQDKDLFDALVAAVERGVTTRILVRESDIPVILDSPLNEVIARTMLPHLGKRLHVRVVAGEPGPFAIVDREKAIVGVKNPVNPRSYFATVYLWDPKFAAELADRYEELWQGAELDVGELVGKEPAEG